MNQSGDLVPIQFHGDTIYAVTVNDRPHIILRPAIEAIGLDYARQYTKLKSFHWATMGVTPTVGADGKLRNMVTIDVRTFLMLLATINSSKVEIWRPVVGIGGYEVSTQGRVRSLDRVVLKASVEHHLKGRVLKLNFHPKGYRMVNLTGGAYRCVHHLVAAAFIGPRPEGFFVCHNDGNPGNNTLLNLRYDTPRENMRDMRLHGTDHNVNKTHCPRGHELSEPNIVRWELARQHRACLACSRARSYIKTHPELHSELQRVSDSYYQTIIKESA